MLDYRLRLPEPHTHLFEVELRIPDADGPLELVMPSWTPGSYLLREFPRHVQEFSAADAAGAPLGWSKHDKNRWTVDAARGAEVVVRYRVHAHELTVRTSHLDASHGYVNGASVFLYVAGRAGEPLSLQIEAPGDWRTTTALRAREHGGGFAAASYDELVDSPLEIGTHALHEWEIDGVPHRYAVWGSGNLDVDRLIRDTTAIVRAAAELFGGLPYPDFTFILHLVPEGRGGLEHRNCCSLQLPRWGFSGRDYESAVALVAHEFFHVWNGTRIRPAALARVDYTRENYTRELWVVEGLTTYYTDVLLLRAGLISRERYLERMAEAITRLRAQPGRRLQSLAESSFDTWIRFYRPDASTPNAQISYYHKGALVGLMLDLAIRGRSGAQRSLDDLMRLLWARYGARDLGYPEAGEPGDVRELAEQVHGAPLGEFFAAAVDGTGELELERVFADAGLELTPDGDAPATDAARVEARLGVRTRAEAGRLNLTHVLAGSPSQAAGLEPGDQLVALDGWRADAATLAARVAELPDDRTVQVAVFRRDALLLRELTPAAPPRPLRLRPVAAPTAEQAAVLAGWLRTRGGAEATSR